MLATALAIEVIYYLVFVVRVLRFKQPVKEQLPPVSVVMCVRNEQENLLNHLELILTQDYPDYEVVVVNDRSRDETSDVLKAFKARHQHLRIVEVPDSDFLYGNKKFGLTLGIKAAAFDHLLFTDADCQPASSQWVKSMAASFDPHQIVLGYGPYKEEKGLLNKLIRFDTFIIGVQYLSMGLAGVPYMGVGRNLAYHRSLFFKTKGFSKHLDLRSGDDDLFINEAATRKNTTICIEHQGQTVSVPKNTFSAWFEQKRRHITTSRRYTFGKKAILGILNIRRYMFWSAAAMVFIAFPVSEWIYCLLGARLLFQMSIFHLALKKLGERGLWYLAPILEILLLLIYPAFAVANATKGPGKWKN